MIVRFLEDELVTQYRIKQCFLVKKAAFLIDKNMCPWRFILAACFSNTDTTYKPGSSEPIYKAIT